MFKYNFVQFPFLNFQKCIRKSLPEIPQLKLLLRKLCVDRAAIDFTSPQYIIIFAMPRALKSTSKSLYISPAVSHGTENEIWAGFGQVGSTKNFGLGRKILLLLKAIFLNIATSALKSCKEKTINFCLKT